MKKLLAFAIVILGFTAVSFGQSATGTAKAKILAGLTVAQGTTGLDFGTLSVPTAAATVVMTAAGARSASAGILLLTQAPVASAAVFNVTGTKQAGYTITLPSAAITLTNASSNTMTLDAFTCDKTDNKSTIADDGTDAFHVGGTLHLKSAQEAGDYAGTYAVTVNYN